MMIVRNSIGLTVGVWLLSVWQLPTAMADQPTAAYIFPAGGQRGSQVELRVGGHNLHNECGFEMLGDGVKFSKTLRRARKTVWFEGPVIPMPASQQKENYPKDQLGRVTIAAGAEPGLRRWRVWTSQGITTTRAFVVGDLPEVVEGEVDGNPIPSRVKPPVTINGRIFPREDVDIWTFSARKGVVYTLKVVASEIGSALDSRITVLDASGRRIAENDDGDSADSFLQFRAPEDGIFSVRIHDAQFGGLQHYVYRLTIDSRMQPRYAFPLGGKRGTAVAVKATDTVGSRLAGTVKIPRDAPDVVQLPLQVAGESTGLLNFETSDHDEYDESRRESDVPIGVKIPTVCNGQIMTDGEVDRWTFSGRKGQQVQVDLRAARLGSTLDSTVSIVESKTGKTLATSDDLSKGETDSRVLFTPPADGKYVVEVRESIEGRFGPRFSYRLHLQPVMDAAPTFQLSLPVDALTIERGGEARIQVDAKRLGGFTGRIKLQVEGLPEKVSLKSGRAVAAQTPHVQLIMKAEEDAVVSIARLKISGVAMVNDKPLQVQASLPESSKAAGLDHLALAVAMPTPFKVVGVFETKYSARGSSYVRHYSIERGEYAGPIEVKLADLQARHLQGVRGQSIVVPAGKSEFDFKIALAPWMQVGRTSRTCVMAVASIKDEQGRQHTVSYTSQEQNDQIIVLVDASQLTVNCLLPTLRARPESTVRLPLKIGRGLGISQEVQVELVVPDHIKGVTAPTLKTRRAQLELPIHFSKDALGPFNMPLVVRVTASHKGLPYVAEGKIQIVGPDRLGE